MNNLLAAMKQKTLKTPVDDDLDDKLPKPGLLKRKPGFRPSQSTEVKPGLMKRLTGK